jgi:predicted RNA binding protein YcfA (HicA-like mRNA interferase family)
MKHSELNRLAIKVGAEFLYQDGSSHRFYKFNGQIFAIPMHGSKEVPTGTCNKILKILGRK